MDEYLKLLVDGETLNYGLMNDFPSQEEWHRDIEELAAADGLRVKHWSEMIGAGSFVVPHVVLAPPGGGNYPWLTYDGHWIESERENARREIEADYGPALDAARARLRRRFVTPDRGSQSDSNDDSRRSGA